jgi:RNA polymerase sigma factor (TIGR02999 family)
MIPEPAHRPDEDRTLPETQARRFDAEPSAAAGITFSWLYEELRLLARSRLANERAGHTLGATALVHEVFLKMKGSAGGQDGLAANLSDRADRARFFSLAARAMRQILVDHARTRGRKKRGGDRIRVHNLPDDLHPAEAGNLGADPLHLDEALRRLEQTHAEAARVVELRVFAGLGEADIAEIMGVSDRTVRRHWTFAKAWLYRELCSEAATDHLLSNNEKKESQPVRIWRNTSPPSGGI